MLSRPCLPFFFNSDCITRTNYDKTFETFIAIIKTEIDKLAPVTKLSKRKSKLALKPWISKGVWISIKKKQKLYKKAYPNGSPLDIFIYKKYSNCLTRIKKAAKKCIKQFENCKCDRLKTWKLLESSYILRNLKKTTRLLCPMLTIKKLMILTLHQKHLTNFFVALLTKFNKP